MRRRLTGGCGYGLLVKSIYPFWEIVHAFLLSAVFVKIKFFEEK